MTQPADPELTGGGPLSTTSRSRCVVGTFSPVAGSGVWNTSVISRNFIAAPGAPGAPGGRVAVRPAVSRRARRVSDRDAIDGVGHADRLRQAARQTTGITPCVEAESGRRAHRGRRVRLREPHTRGSKPVQVRRPDLRRTEAGQVGPAEVVGEDDELLDRRVGWHPAGRLRGKGTGARSTDEPTEPAPADASWSRCHRAPLPHATTSTPKLGSTSTMRQSVPQRG